MKRILLILVLMNAFSASAQFNVIITNDDVFGVAHTTDTGFQKLTVYYKSGEGRCRLAEYTTDPHTTLAKEQKTIVQMMDSAKAFGYTDALCKFSINTSQYDDLTLKLIDIFSASPEWQHFLDTCKGIYRSEGFVKGTNPGKIHFDEQLATNILNKTDIFKGVEALLKKYGYKIASWAYPAKGQQIVSKEELQHLGKNTKLIIPLPDPLVLVIAKM